MAEQPDEAQLGTPPVDPEAFAKLFFHPKKNRHEIWVQMSRIVVRASREIRGRTPADMDDFRGEALAHAMDQVQNYDPARRTAYFYFYGLIQKNLLLSASRSRHAFMGDSDSSVCFHALNGMDKVAEERERACSNLPNNWRSFRLSCQRDRHIAEKYFRVTYRRAKEQLKRTDSEPEKAAIAIILETVRQARRALVG